MKTIETIPEILSERFPDRVETIKALLESSPTFREICDDFEEMATWIANHCQAEKKPSGNCEYAFEVLRDLEAEIMDCLEGSHITVAMEHDSGADWL